MSGDPDPMPVDPALTSRSWEARADRLASSSIAAGDPTGWFDRLYSAGAAGEVAMPWNRETPHPLLAPWAQAKGLAGEGRRAVVVGSALGADAEYVAGLGFGTVGFDVSETAVRLARERYPQSGVDYVVADLLAPPAVWSEAFDLVVEIFTVQALPDPPRSTAIGNVGRLVAAGGTLLVIEFRTDGSAGIDGPPWPLSREQIDAFAEDGLDQVGVEEIPSPAPGRGLWRAEFRRP